MPYPVVPDVPGFSQSDPATSTQKVNVLAANTPPTLAQDGEVVAISPANTGLPVNTPKIVQSAGNVSSGAVASLAKAFTNNNVAGNSIVVVCAVGNGTAATVTDSAGNTYNAVNNAANSTTFAAQIFWASGIVAGANTVTVTPSASVSVAMEIYEVSGLLAPVTTQPDQSATSNGTGTTASTANVTPVVPNELFFGGVAVGTAAQTITPASGWNNDSGQQNVGGTPSGLFSFVSMSYYRGGTGPLAPSATIGSSEPWAMAVASFRTVALPVEGKFYLGSDYPFGAIPITADSGNVANATATATLAGVSGKTTYITGYIITASGATAASVVTGTVTGIITGTQHFTYTAVAGATTACQPLVVTLPKAVPASAANTGIAIALPALGSGNTNATVQAYGYQL